MEPAHRPPRAVLVLVVGGREVTLGPVGAARRPDLDLVDDLLRLRLAAGRAGASLRLVEVNPHLRALVELVGAADRLGLDPSPDPRGQPSMRGGSPNSSNSEG